MSWFSSWPAQSHSGLDSKVRAALEALGPVPEYRTLDVHSLRATFRQQAAGVPRLDEPVAKVEDRRIGELPIRIYYSPRGESPRPALVFFHGGGWVVGDLDTHDQVCRSLASRAGAVVVAVHYRLAPETPYPGALEDGAAAIRWTAEHATELGVDARRIAVGGDSAGGNLAAVLAIQSRDGKLPRLWFQLLIYPVTDCSWDTESYKEFASGYGLTRSNMIWFWEVYRGKGRADDPLLSPLRRADLRGVAPALVLTAEYDVLRDEGERYAARLDEAGVAVRCIRFRGLNHGFIRMGAVYPQANQALNNLALAIATEY
jgi:acetyl esterase